MTKASEKRILVVDDEPDVRKFIAACVEDAGFNVDTAKDGEDALEKIKADPPDLMTLDMVMPKISGIQVLRRLRKNKEWAEIPVIVITAHASDEMGSEDIKQFTAFTSGQGPKHVLEKPITPASLVKAICKILDVDPEEAIKQSTEKNEVKSLINACDPDTLKKIRDMLNK
ncbi:MAG: response regulator [Desulfobacterales bacterium]|nr:response regulator [Desulfobacterales bacterium]